MNAMILDTNKKNLADLVADLTRDPGFVLVSQDRYEELIRAETERDVLEATIVQDKYYANAVMTSIRAARKGLYRSKSAEDERASAANDHAE